MDNKQILTLEDKKKLKLNAVTDIASFSEDYLEISTSLGTVSVEGTGMKIESLSHENGDIVINGEISGIFYQNKVQKKKIFRNK